MKLEHLSYDNFVYDLQVEEDESYTANGFVVHNCAMIPLPDGFPEPKFQKGEAWFKSLGAADQRKILGPGRYDAWREGKFQFSQLATIRQNETWGPSAQVTPLRELLRK